MIMVALVESWYTEPRTYILKLCQVKTVPEVRVLLLHPPECFFNVGHGAPVPLQGRERVCSPPALLRRCRDITFVCSTGSDAFVCNPHYRSCVFVSARSVSIPKRLNAVAKNDVTEIEKINTALQHVDCSATAYKTKQQ